jgi:ABC-type Fe3+ transport system permease subunit
MLLMLCLILVITQTLVFLEFHFFGVSMTFEGPTFATFATKIFFRYSVAQHFVRDPPSMLVAPQK